MKSVNITGTDIAWVMFAVIVSGLGTVALTKLSTIKEPDAVAQAHQASMKEQLLTTTPGDLAVINGGRPLILGFGREYVVHDDMVYYNDIHAMPSPALGKKNISIFSSMTERVVKKDNPSYGVVASCLLQGKMVVEVDHRYTCG